jgi:hypothetical protein
MASSQLSAQDATQKAYTTAYDAAVKAGLSSQEAQQQAQLMTTQGLINSGLSAQGAAQEMALAKYKASAEYNLRMAEYAKQAQLSAQAFNQNIKEANNKATNDQKLDAQQQAGANYRAELEATAQASITSANISSSEKKTFAEQLRITGDTFQSNFVAIQRDPNVPTDAKEEVVADVRKQYEDTVTYITTIYGADVSWGLTTPAPSATPAPSPAPAPGATPAPALGGYSFDVGGAG